LESKEVNPIKLWPESIQKMQKFFLCAIAFYLELHRQYFYLHHIKTIIFFIL